ncbi:hypothetical protein [uncultured Enterovirga sp.]|uniref:hypothetical protein n=1 Tax=uncultured Enterovirga sp. TaxID=2026352 RepID=UPI0035CBF3BF
MAPFVYLVQLAIAEEHEDSFNQLYETGYIPELLKIPGVLGCARFRLDWADTPDIPEYLALYDIENPEIPRSEAWRQASISCGWAKTIRPHLHVRRHGMYRRIGGSLQVEPTPPF